MWWMLLAGCLQPLLDDLDPYQMDQDGDGSVLNVDCDDLNADVLPDNPNGDGCDGIDNDCDESVDEDPDIEWFLDADEDGYGDPDKLLLACSQPDGHVDNADDCNDLHAGVNPGAAEIAYNLNDDDCSGDNEGEFDLDGDGVDCSSEYNPACPISTGLDCDDDPSDDVGVAAKDIYPGAVDEWYDGIDADCAGNRDYDKDGDDQACQSEFDTACPHDSGTDCNDQDSEVYLGAPDEWYDGDDDDCMGDDDFDQDGDEFSKCEDSGDTGCDCNDLDGDINPDGIEKYYDGVDQDCKRDDDYNQDTDDWPACSEPGDTGACDCDDLNAKVFPGAVDVLYDGLDADCANDKDFDSDHDGWNCSSEFDAGCPIDSGMDCDDHDGAFAPDAFDEWYDNIDHDCQGNDDFDRDYDGVSKCQDTGDTDCDCIDTDDNAYPGADEIWYDGKDQNCSGDNDQDQDGDGFLCNASAGKVCDGDDCDDLNAMIHPLTYWYSDTDEDGAGNPAVFVHDTGSCDPGAGTWVPENNTDCAPGDNGVESGCILNLEDNRLAGVYGETGDGRVGEMVARGQLGGGAGPDMVVTFSGLGQTAVFHDISGSTSTIPASDATVIFTADKHDVSVWATSVGQVFGSSDHDVLLTSRPNALGVHAPSVWLMEGPFDEFENELVNPTDVGISMRLASLEMLDTNDTWGQRTARVGRMGDDDSRGEVLIACPEWSDGDDKVGAVWLIYSQDITSSGDFTDVGSAGVRFVGEEHGAEAGMGLSSNADVDGDGEPDIVIGSPGVNNDLGETVGAAYLVFGEEDLDDLDLSDADQRWYGETENSAFGQAVYIAGDLDADGYSDLIFGAPEDEVGFVTVVYGSPNSTGRFDESDADIRIEGDDALDSNFGTWISDAADVNQDGRGDFLVGAPEYGGSDDNGAIYLFHGTIEAGTFSATAAHSILTGADETNIGGEGQFVGVSDLDSDDVPDMIVGVPASDPQNVGAESGAVGLVANQL
jgi:hypothetical protein